MHLLCSTRRLCAAAVGAAVLLAFASPASAQLFDARRLAMGGVQISDLGSGGNVAYEGIPKSGDRRLTIPIPLGLIQLAADPPEFDTDDSLFNAFDIANLILHPPFALQVSKPATLEDDIRVTVARDSLRIDLGDLQRLVPQDDWKLSALARIGFTQHISRAFVGAHVQGVVENSVALDTSLRNALGNAVPFVANTRYGLSDSARAQMIATLEVGTALPVVYQPRAGGKAGDKYTSDPRKDGATALYVGARGKYLKGLAYADAQGSSSVDTQDPLFGTNNSLGLNSEATVRSTQDADQGSGVGADLGAVLFVQGVELGVGLNDVGSKINWTVDRDRYYYDSVADSFVTQHLAVDEEVKIAYPISTTLSAAWHGRLVTLGATAQRRVGDWTYHFGGEFWATPLLALRAGWLLDGSGKAQYTGGAGVRMGPIGLDLALATSSLTVTRERVTDLALSLVIY